MGKGFLTYSTAVILQAVANGYHYGFDIMAYGQNTQPSRK